MITYPTVTLDRNKVLDSIRIKKKIQSELLLCLKEKNSWYDYTKQQYISFICNSGKGDLRFREELEYRNLDLAIKKKENQLEVDETFTRRVNVEIKFGGEITRFQLRLQDLGNRRFNARKKKTANTPNLTHCLDASILQNVIVGLGALGLQCAYIHDSIGTSVSLCTLVTFLYKKEVLDIILQSMAGRGYPPYD